MKNVLIIDNYDSFVYNVVQLLRESRCLPHLDIVFNDRVREEDILRCDGVLLSPGPGVPREANRLMAMIDSIIRRRKPVLGICLGHQALAEAFGAQLRQMESPLHGHASPLRIADGGDPIFRGVDRAIVGRYHSWVVDPQSLPPELKVSAWDEQDNIMAFYHASLPVHGVQFHPESVITDCGRQLIDNWLEEL